MSTILTPQQQQEEASDALTLSIAQDKVLTILPIVPSILSVIGSLTIVYLVLTDSKKKTSYRRLLLRMSLCDIIFSISYPLQAFLLPAETSRHIWATGSEASCTALGFLTQFSFSAMLYNGMLSYYFLLTVRCAWREDQFARWVEPWVHGVSLGYPLLTAIAGAVMGAYGEVDLGAGCWVADYPKGCGEDSDVGMCMSPLIAWSFGGCIIFFVFLSLIVNNGILYWHVRSTFSAGHRRSTVREIQMNSDLYLNTKKKSKTGRRMPDTQAKQTRAVATQAFLYVAGFGLTYIWSLIIRTLDTMGFGAEDEMALFPLLVLQACFLPLQGVFNLLVYVRPRYMKSRHDFPLESRLWAFRRVLFGNEVEPKASSNNHEQSKPECSRDTKDADAEASLNFGAARISSGFSVPPPMRETTATSDPMVI